MLKVLVAAAIFGSVLAATPAGATHDTIYSPCSTEYGFIHMTYDEWAAHITTMEANGTIPEGVVFRYWEANHTTGKGTNVQEDGTIPAWDQWARNLTDGQILSLDDWLNGDYPEIEELMFSSGLVPEWILDANMTIRRVDDPYWTVANPMTPTFTIWQSLCMANYGYSIPVMEINDDGVWVSNLPATTTTSAPNPEPPQQKQDEPITTTTLPPPTTTSLVVEDPVSEIAPPVSEPDPLPQPTPTDNWVERWFDAEWNDYPFQETIVLLEERYPVNTPGKYHFRLSTAVDFLRSGGKIKGLDHLWESGQ